MPASSAPAGPVRARGVTARLCALVGAVLAAAAALPPPPAVAQAVRVIEGPAIAEVSVDVNRAVVLETEEPFVEVSIANPAIADLSVQSNRSIYLLGKAAGSTTLTLFGANGRLIGNVGVTVSPDLAEFKRRLSAILPGEPVQVRAAADGIVLSGQVSSAVQVSRAVELAGRYAPERVVNMMTVGGSQQVLLRVRFAEVQRSASKALGFNWSVGAQFGNFGVSGSTGDFLVPGNTRGRPVPGGIGADYTAGSPTEGILRLGFGAGGIVANLAVDALESKGAARTLAEPNLTALSGDTANFLAGGEYPIPVFSDDGLAVEYRPFGVALGFTPTVLGDVINLAIEAESSNIDPTIVIENQGIRFTGFSTRRARTTIELRDGQSFAIAGLLQDEFVDNANQIPWLGDVPVLGALFRSADFRRRQTELVILVTAHLVNPVPAASVVLPTDRIRLPSERELFLLGRLEGQRDPTLRAVAARDFEGAFGYVLD